MKPIFFKNTKKLRDWLAKNHAIKTELWLGYFKKNSPKYNYSWSDTVDELICFGWIDGLRKSIDKERYMIRITPRKPNSNWSKINIEKATNLIEKGLMTGAGLKAFEIRREKKSKIYSFEQQHIELSSEFEELFQKNKKAWEFFKQLSPTTKKQSVWWINSAKRKETQLNRLAILIESSEKKQKIPPLNWAKK